MSTTREQDASTPGEASLLVCLPALAPEANGTILNTLAEAFLEVPATVALPDVSADTLRELTDGMTHRSLKLVSYVPAAQSNSSWTLTAADFLNAHELMRAYPAATLLLLGAEAQSLGAAGLKSLYREAVTTHCDLVTARYALPPRAGLVNSAVLYPISRALFGASSRFPLAIDLCLSARMVERLAMSAQRSTAANLPDALLWPAAESAAAGYITGQADVGTRTLPQPATADLNAMLAQVVGSLFADVEAKASVWQRVRVAPAFRPGVPTNTSSPAAMDEVRSAIEAFRLAYSNLLEVWALVLPPQSLLGLKRLAAAPPESFRMADSLWARIVYDFLLAYRLRTLNRNHLLGALTPLYLAWVASHLLQTGEGVDPEVHIQLVAAAFEADKPYMVSRWRWPDRFNP
jgi:hypothetical protein